MEFLYKGVRGCAMTTPFDTAWALLKTNLNTPPINQQHIQQMNEFVNSIPPNILTEDDRYPLTPEEETLHNAYIQAYSKARPPNMTDEMYDDHIERTVQLILNGPSNKPLLHDYPWPKRKVFQSTFENDGSINRDPMLSRQRKLNARMARERNHREAVPSKIQIDPDPKSNFIRNFSLLDDEGNMISRIRGDGGGINNNPHIHDFYGETKEPYRRQGMYRKLMQSLIGAGFPLLSNERNSQSDTFHRKFMQNLPPNIEGEYITEDDGSYHQKLGYQRQNVPQFLDAQGQRSGLNRLDYGAIPIVNQANQARSMDELAEQDRAKIQRGQGHRPEMLPLLVTQPMARNTQQITFDDFYERQNNPQ
jgi:hypothetical protein